jgi:biotin carboxylase
VRPRLLLLVPTTSYRTDDFLEAAGYLDVDLTVASEQAGTLNRRNPAGLLALSFARPELAATQVRRFAERYPVAAVVGVDDATAPLAAVLAKALGLPHNPPRAVLAAKDKFATRQITGEAGLLSPWFGCFSVDDEPEAVAARVPYPCVLKPLVLSASRGVIRANAPAEFAAAFRRIAGILGSLEEPVDPDAARQILVEGFIPGREVALEGLLIEGRLHVLCLFDKPDPLDGPYFEETLYVTPSRLPDAVQAQVTDTVARAAAALGLREGPVHAELRVNEAGAWLLEVNPRSIGGRCSRVLRFGAGMSLEELILRHALRLELPSLDRERAAAGVMMLPIPGAGVLQEVRGQETALAVPGIEELILTAHKGQKLVPLPEGAPYLGFLFARGETPEQVEAGLRTAHSRLEVAFDTGIQPALDR